MRAGAGPTTVFVVEGMHCPSCGFLVDDVVEELPGVAASTTDVRAGRTLVRSAGDQPVDQAAVVEAITALGYAARPVDGDDRPTEGGR